jgi:hypothetical protein
VGREMSELPRQIEKELQKIRSDRKRERLRETMTTLYREGKREDLRKKPKTLHRYRNQETLNEMLKTLELDRKRENFWFQMTFVVRAYAFSSTGSSQQCLCLGSENLRLLSRDQEDTLIVVDSASA